MKKPKHKTAITSIIAYYRIIETLSERRRQIYKAIYDLDSCSNTMIAEHLKIPINCVTGRVFELRKFHVVMLDKRAECPITEEFVNFWKVRRK